MTKKFQRNYFEAIVGAFDGLVYICSMENKIEYINRKVIDQIGRDVTGEYCFKALHGLSDVCPWCKEQEVFKAKVVRWEFKNSQTGSWFNFMASPIFHSDGSISKLTLCSDITKGKLAEKALKESERKLQTLMNNLPGMVFRCKADPQLTMDFASDGSYKLLGCHPSDIIGKGATAFKRLVDPRERGNLIQCVNTALNEKRSYSLIYQIKKMSGEIVWVWEQGEGVFSGQGKLLGIEGFITDITQQKKAELDLRKENIQLKSFSQDRYKFGDLVGKSPEMQTVYDLIMKAASNDVNVVIFGESGTGKELVAQSIHRLSDRKKKELVTVNCGAINKNLMESEFFGYVKGAFTGANVDKLGYLDRSDGGILFLDELGEMPKSMQVLLLRAIDRKEYTPVGGNKTKTSDFRIIAATHHNLPLLVKKNEMREDFFYRIHILAIHLPPLRRRKEDIPLLVDHFIDFYPGKKNGKNRIPAHIMELFQQYDWPGNVRELQNAVHRYLAFEQIDFAGESQTLNQSITDKLNGVNELKGFSMGGLNEIMARLEKKVLRNALEKHRWNRGRTAEFLNIDRKTLYRKIRNYALTVDE